MSAKKYHNRPTVDEQPELKTLAGQTHLNQFLYKV